MDTRSNSPVKSWSTLAAGARQFAPPGDIDVRAAVRRQIEAEEFRKMAAREPIPDLYAELLALAGRFGFRCALAAGGFVAAGLLVAGALAVREVLQAAQVAGPLLAGF